MAKMAPGIHFTGTIGNVCYYQVGDRTYLRSKSSLTRKRVLDSKEFASTRKHASAMGRASKIGSVIYRGLPADIKARWIFRIITGEAASLLYSGKNEEDVKALLWKKYIEDASGGNKESVAANCANIVPSTKESKQRLKKILMNRWEEKGYSAYQFKSAWTELRYFDTYDGVGIFHQRHRLAAA